MELKTTNGFDVLLDEEDVTMFLQFRWHAMRRAGENYVRRDVKINGKVTAILLHRVLMGAGIGEVVDHINGNPLDNRKENLRVCSHSENKRNSKARRHSATGIRNVAFVKGDGGRKGRWRACVTVDGVRHRKNFKDASSAEKWAIEKRRELHGDFAYDPAADSRQSEAA